MRELMGYCLGRALEKNPGIELFAYSANTTHPHAVARDAPAPGRPSALPRFFQLLHSLMARAMNTRLGRGGPLFCPGSYDNVELHGQPTLEEQLVYAWTNVTKDGLVERAADWPGLQFLPEDLGRTFVFTKPRDAFFGGRRPPGTVPTDPSALAEWRAKLRDEELVALAKLRRDDVRHERGDKRRRQLARERARRRKRKKEAAAKPLRASRSTLPESVKVTIGVPPGYERWPIEEVRAHFRRLVDAREAEIAAERRAAGFTRVKGVAAILAEDPREGPGETWPSFARNPRIACSHDRRERIAHLRGLRAWRADVRAKYERWRNGERDVVFPVGTYGVGVFHGARVEGIVRRTAVTRVESHVDARPPPEAA